ncbi:MAG: TonB-dependent receptor [Flavobacterium sp.]|uniref:SusC/RagA family TonB-linked outer membrane protein n=1 Tax=Flavobacterium sp. TaxID=239 RepID=UPI0012027A8C|nr:TonB-dependent receptor [Flavobacterium sp.]RZJ66316.1 MAG: TonB-dependent receptor [Flavobacterium sp.]
MKRKITYYLFLMWAFLSTSAIYAQTVKGTVSDNGGPLPMVNVNVKGTSINTATDIDGNYTLLDAGPNAVLVFTYVGYLPKEVPVNGESIVNAVLVQDPQLLNEVIVTGYSSQQKRSISGAVAQVDMEDLSKTRVPDVTQALQGQVAGVFVAASTGAPGDGIQLRVRGQGTLGNNDVLYVIDGVPSRSITFLNQADIKSMTVLKDAASASQYGSRAAGGVILITTKRGSEGKSSFEAEVFTGVHFATNLPDMLNTEQYLNVQETSYNNTAGNNPANNPYTALRSRTDLADTDWLDELFETGITTSAQVTASGGSDKISYLISGGYYGVDGIVKEDNDRYKRVNFRTNLNAKVSDRFSVGTNLQLTFIKQDKLSSAGDAPGVIRHAMIRPSALAVFKDPSDPTWSAEDPYTDLPFYTGPNGGWNSALEFTSNPLAIVHFTDDKRELFQTFGNVYAEYSFLGDKSLKFRSNLGVDAKFIHNKNFAQNYGDANQIFAEDHPYFGLGRNNLPNNLSENRGQDVTFTWSNTLNYVKTIGDHDINALIGTEYITNSSETIGGTRSYYDITLNPFLYLDYGSVGSDQIARPYSGGSGSGWTLFSYFATATYGYKNKLFATGTMRADASSRFGPNNKWGYFPSVSANYILSNESFMKEVSWLSNLKLRASYGKNGNQEIPNYAYQALYINTENGPQLTRFGNDDVQWETTTQTNFGVDFGFFKNKLTFSADYFFKKTDDILLTVTPPGTLGSYAATYINSGAVENKGFEFFLGYQNNDNEFKYGVSANLATLKNEVTKLYTYVNNIEDNINYTRTVVGQPIASYYGYQFDGIYQNQAEIDNYLFADANGAQPGDMKFRDINADGKIDANDRTFIGNPIPEFTYGLNFSASYKGFDLSFLFQGVSNVDRYNDLKQILDYDSRPFNSTTAVLDAWNGEGTSNTMPRLTFNANGSERISSAMIEDASYVRLKNIELGYTFPSSIKTLNNLRIYVSGQNLLTWTNYTGLDPESVNLKDQGTYPQMTSVMFGARIKL